MKISEPCNFRKAFVDEKKSLCPIFDEDIGEQLRCNEDL